MLLDFVLTGRVYHHHAIIEANHAEDGFLNVIAYTKEGIGRSVIDHFDGLQQVCVQSKPNLAASSSSKGYFTGAWGFFGGTKQKDIKHETTVPTPDAEKATVAPADQIKAYSSEGGSAQREECKMDEAEASSKQKREEAYQRAKSMLGKKASSEQSTCEKFAFWCSTGQHQEPHDCPMCKTTGQTTKHILH